MVMFTCLVHTLWDKDHCVVNNDDEEEEEEGKKSGKIKGGKMKSGK